MRSKIKFLLLLLLAAQHGFAQRAKLNPSLLREIIKKPESSRQIALMVQGEPSIVAQQVKTLGGLFKFSVNNISSVTLPMSNVETLAASVGISRIEGLYGNGVLLDEKTLINANVNPVHDGSSPLNQPYDGAGVVMAFLDDGIDFNHPDFKNADGTTRILDIWDQTALSGGITPQPYNYGQEWDSAVINSGTCPYYETSIDYGHGSNVAGIGAGNGLAVNNYLGIAPASDIIAVNVALDENFLNNVVDATEYSFEKAASLGKPCVINASLGTYFGSHDGYDLAAQMIDALITEQHGRSFVCAAGNAGNIPFHLGYDTHPDSSFTWFAYTGFLGQIFYEWWIDKDAASGFQFAVGADDPASWQFLGRTKYYNLITDFTFVNGYSSITEPLIYNGDTTGIITIEAYQYDSTYACDISITQITNTEDRWRFITNGTGRFDLWSASNITGTSDMFGSQYLPDLITFPDGARYVISDVSETTVSSFTCSDKVIAVANYVNRDQYIDYYNNLQTFIPVPGTIAAASSLGPSRDGRIKPEIAAPGDITLASGLIYLMDDYILNQSFKVAPGGMHIRNGGTSMASPVVAGVAALFLQKNPDAEWKEIKDAIELSAVADTFTGFTLPNNTWGYGKINAFDAMTTMVTYGCTNPYSINFNPYANVDDESCIPIVFGCNDINAVNYNAAANTNDGSCAYNTGIGNAEVTNSFSCYPNPAVTFTTFFFQKSIAASDPLSRIIIQDQQGRVAATMLLSGKQDFITYHFRLSPGVYFCRLEATDCPYKIIKLVVQ